MAGGASQKNNQSLSKRGGSRPGAGRKLGVPNKVNAEVREIAQRYTEKAVKALADIVENSESDSARVAAANALLDRGHGRPSQSVSVSAPDGGPIKHLHELSDDLLANIAVGK